MSDDADPANPTRRCVNCPFLSLVGPTNDMHLPPTPYRSARSVAKPDFKALYAGTEADDDGGWSSEELDAEMSGRKRRGGKRAGKSSAKSRQRKTAAVGELEAAAAEEEAQLAQLAPQAEILKQKYAELEQGNEAIKERIQEVMQAAAAQVGAEAAAAVEKGANGVDIVAPGGVMIPGLVASPMEPPMPSFDPELNDPDPPAPAAL